MQYEENEHLTEKVLEKIEYGEKLLVSFSKFSNLQGIKKVQKKIEQELKFLRKIYKTNSAKQEHMHCPVFKHYSAVINALKKTEGCLSLNEVFNFEGKKVIVDILCDGSLTWIKVIARNPKSLTKIHIGDASYKVLNILDQAKEYVECAKLYPVSFQIPKIIFIFIYGISCQLTSQLEDLGIVVEGNRIEDLDLHLKPEFSYKSELSTKHTSYIIKVNVDVSTMIAYVSSMTNGSCRKYRFAELLYNQEAERESQQAMKPILDAFFKDKKLYCCKTAYNSFINVIDILGGPNEKKRSEEFLARITVLPDDASTADTIETTTDNTMFNRVQFTLNEALLSGKKMKKSLTIFTFGDRIQAVTITSNDKFVQAAKEQGIHFVVFVHDSRCLTEKKELEAELIA